MAVLSRGRWIEILIAPSTSAEDIAARLDAPYDVSDAPGSAPEPGPWLWWTELHYWLGALEPSVLVDASLFLRAIDRDGDRATVTVTDGRRRGAFTVDLTREIDAAIDDLLALAWHGARPDARFRFLDE